MNVVPHLVVALALFVPFTAVNSAPEADKLQAVSRSTVWQRLMHYSISEHGHSAKSQVDDADFFLAEDGRTNPQHELSATLEAFYFAVSDPDQHAICRYPSRWKFLSAQFDLAEPPLTPADCPEFSQWLAAMDPHSVSLVLASSYLNSPSSMFGHTFLRVDPANVEQGSKWLSYAVNFGAELNAQDNSILYAYKGLFGGYPGFFSIIPYYEKIQEYSHIENRDLWEYNLNLNPQETRDLVSHLWELRDIEFDYYFFDENCSYRLLELLEFARPTTELTKDFSYRAIPIDTIRSVLNGDLVDTVDYRPSSSTEIEYRISLLDQEQQALAWQIAHKNASLESPQLTALPAQEQAGVLQLAYKHLRYLQLENPRNQVAAQYSLDLLRELSRLPDKKASHPPTPEVSPDQGHKTFLLGLTGGESMDTGFLDLRVRLSYHDLADNRAGYLDGAAINLGELRLRKSKDDGLQIEDLSFVDINSHSPRNRFFNPITWRVQLGMQRQYSSNDDFLTTQAHGGAGLTYQIAQPVLVYGLAMGRVEFNELLDTKLVVAAGALAGGLAYLPFGTLQLESQYYQFSDGKDRHATRLIQNLPLGQNSALRFSASHNKQVETDFDEFSLEFRYYL
ncbi:Lnb N-terminal periplasmic domain-containing protein [Ketobacter sp.]